ncbi:ABC transporter substrate-binding protein [Bradyrhizobium prioriisuperbiae]|uniref:ABC transporter substrate-binding protein n=1 Tax=Bradyrhizobium prioriisuperbiae TaxID=2854389 RepID=UPI0028E9F556|nr:ABC transporter substrate-binding protein [Bradyrhizobium prioritasuperba]
MNSLMNRRQFGAASIGGAVAAMAGRRALAAAPTPITFQANWLNDPEFLGYMLAIDKGYYEEAGLKVTYLPGGPNVIPEGSLLTRKSDIALTALLTTATAIVQKGAPLKVIGTQYQKSPLGVIAMASSNIKGPADLAGKTVAVPTLSADVFKAFVKLHKVENVKIVPYAFNPAPLINGEVDATVDFATQLPFIIEQSSGKKASYFLFDDHGLPLLIDLVTVTTDTLSSKRPELLKFLQASRRGWAENFADPSKYPELYHDTWFKGTGSTVGAEKFFNAMQPSLVNHPKGLFTITEEAIEQNLKSLSSVGVTGRKDMFDTSLLAEI